MHKLLTLSRQLVRRGRAGLLALALLPVLAQAQTPVVTVAPAGPFTLCPGTTRTLTASAILPGFNTGGAGFDGEVKAVVVQPDGKVLVGGTFGSYDGNAAAPNGLLRLNADGSRDASFNPGGTGVDGQVYALALQANGQVLVGGGFSGYNGNAAAPHNVLRLNADGTLDTSFNPGGSGTSGAVYAVAVYAVAGQADGKVLVGGNFFTYNDSPYIPNNLLRLNANGSFDTSYNGSGTGPNAEVYALVVQPDGKALAGGHFTGYDGINGISKHFLRLTTTGGLDTTFGGSAIGADDDVLALALQPNGQVLAGGIFTTFHGAPAPDGVMRVNADGFLDIYFNNGGRGTNSYVTALAVQADGKVLVGGSFTTYDNSAAKRLLRLTTNGSLDTDFNSGGSGPDSYVNAVAAQPDGRVLVGGNFTTYDGNAAAPDYLLRLNADGSLHNAAVAATGLTYQWSNGATGASITVSAPGDYQATATNAVGTGYSNVVRVSAPPAVAVAVTPAGPLVLPGGGSAVLSATATVPGFNVGGIGFDGPVYAVAAQPDGKVLVGGDFTGINGQRYASPDKVLRLNADGTLDQSFNGGGPLGAGPRGTQVLALAVQPDGKVLVGGNFLTYNGTSVPRLIRLNANGSLDTSFNPGGSGPNAAVSALVVQPDGKVLVGGTFGGYNGNAAAPHYVLRLNANGSLDASFNGNRAGLDNAVSALVLQPNGQVLVGGSFTTYNGSAAPGRVLRLNADGSLDTGFNGGGTGANSAVQALALQVDGKVLVGGNFNGYNGDLAAPDYLLRLNADGSRDTGFNGGGAGLTGTFVGALAVQADGKVLAGGSFTGYDGSAAAPDNVLRLTATGSLDTNFNNGGSGASGIVYALAALPSGPVLAGGSFGDYNGSNAPDNLLRLRADGTLDDAATPLAGATFTFNPGGTAGSTRTVTTAGSYTATASDPATGCGFVSNAVVVTQAAPTLTAITPNSGVSGDILDLTGTNLSGATRIDFTYVGGFLAGLVESGFTVMGNTGITGAVVPPYLAPGTYAVTVNTPAGTTNGLTYTVPNQAPTALALSNTTVAENAGANATVGTLSATDPDGADLQTFTLVTGAGSTDNGSFNLSGPDGEMLRLTASADFEAKSSYAIRVRTTDPGGLFFEQTFTITVTNVNEAPTIGNQTRSVAEHAPTGTAVGAPLTASDPDANTTLTYSIIGGNGTGSGAFAIGGSTGQLTVADAAQLGYATTPVFTLTVQVSDGSLTSSATITVNLTAAKALVVSAGTPGSPTAIAPGSYPGITITGTGSAILTGGTTVTGPVLVQSGGTLLTNCQPLTGSGSFTLAAGATLGICDAAGLSSTPGTGAVQTTGEHSFSDDAIYLYDGSTAQQTGNALPGTVRELQLRNKQGATLTQVVAVRQRVELASGDLTLAGQALTLLSTADGTALVDNTGGRVLGSTGTMQRHIETNTAGNGYRHYSSPVQQETVNTLATTGYAPDFSGAAAYNASATPGAVSPFPTVFGYEQGRVGTVGSNYSAFNQGFLASLAGEAMLPGHGFVVNAPGTALVDFTGTFTSGAVTLPGLARGTDAAAGWQLLGNPYPSPLDWRTLTVGTSASANLQNLNGAVYVARSSGPYTGSYRTFLAAAPGSADPLIPAGQGFFVRTTTAGTPGTLRLTNANRVTTFGPQPAFGRSAAEVRPWLQLELASPTATDELTVYCDPAATLGLDAAYDAPKLGNPNGLNLSALVGLEALAVDGLPALAALPTATVLPLRLTVPTAGTYTLRVPTLANFDGATVYLRDAQAGTEQLLAAGFSQVLALAPAGNTAPRYSLVLRPATALATAAGGALAQASVYPNPARGRFTLTLPPVAGAATARITLLNVLGEVVGGYALPLTAGGATADYPTTNLATGVYALRVTAGEQTTTLRLVVE